MTSSKVIEYALKSNADPDHLHDRVMNVVLSDEKCLAGALFPFRYRTPFKNSSRILVTNMLPNMYGYLSHLWF